MPSPTALGANTFEQHPSTAGNGVELPGSSLNSLPGMEINHFCPNRAATNVAHRPHATGQNGQPGGSVSWRRIGRRPRKSPKNWTRCTPSSARERRASKNKNLVTKNFVASVKCSVATLANCRWATPSRRDPHAHARTEVEGAPAFYRAQILTAEPIVGDSAAGHGETRREAICARYSGFRTFWVTGAPAPAAQVTRRCEGNAGRCVGLAGLQSRPQAIDS
jgi:hypothetical protein